MKITRKMTQEIRPKIYFCDSPESIVYYPDNYTSEIYIEKTDSEHPFDIGLEEWKIYAEEEKDKEIRYAIEKRFKLSQKPTLCFILEKKDSKVEEIVEEDVPSVPEFVLKTIEDLERRRDLAKTKERKERIQNVIDGLKKEYGIKIE